MENAREESSETVMRLETSWTPSGQCLYCCITILHIVSSTVLASLFQTEIEVHLRFTLGSLSTSLSSIPFQPVYHLVTSSKFGLLLSHADNTCTAEREGRKIPDRPCCARLLVLRSNPRPSHEVKKEGSHGSMGSWYETTCIKIKTIYSL